LGQHQVIQEVRMTKTSAKIVLDSVSPAGSRLVTLQLVFPRIILAEFNTHRMLSRNAASSRAIPVKKMLEQVRNEPFVPSCWGKNQPGMQAEAELDGLQRELTQERWLDARNDALNHVEALMNIGLHKQLANRLLEPWMWSHVVVTATEWGNFLNLRLHPAAQPEMRELAEHIRDAIRGSAPQSLSYGAWHLPYVTPGELSYAEERYPKTARKLSVARCARVSYQNHDGTAPDVAKDVELHDRLAQAGHWSPFEHQATPMDEGFEKNFHGWRQYRADFPNENQRIYEGS
jgi:thymidylate synthase ThyX